MFFIGLDLALPSSRVPELAALLGGSSQGPGFANLLLPLLAVRAPGAGVIAAASSQADALEKIAFRFAGLAERNAFKAGARLTLSNAQGMPSGSEWF